MAPIFISDKLPLVPVVIAISSPYRECCCLNDAHSDEDCPSQMSIRTTHKTVKFSHPVSIEGVGRVLPAGSYEIMTDEELIEGLSFPVYRRVSTVILAPTQSSMCSIEMLTIDPHDLAAAMKRDTLTVEDVSVPAKLN